MITFLFADVKFGLINTFAGQDLSIGNGTAYFTACLIGIVGATSIWLTWHYSRKSNSMRDMLVICAWTHRVKSNGKWIPLEEFFTTQLGYAVSHGLSEARLMKMRHEFDSEWKNITLQNPAYGEGSKELME